MVRSTPLTVNELDLKLPRKDPPPVPPPKPVPPVPLPPPDVLDGRDLAGDHRVGEAERTGRPGDVVQVPECW